MIAIDGYFYAISRQTTNVGLQWIHVSNADPALIGQHSHHVIGRSFWEYNKKEDLFRLSTELAYDN